MKKLLYLLLIGSGIMSLQGGAGPAIEWKGRNDEEAMAEYAELVARFSEFKTIESQLASKKAQEEKEKNELTKAKESELAAKKAAEEVQRASEYAKELADKIAKKASVDKTKQQEAYKAKKAAEDAERAAEIAAKQL